MDIREQSETDLSRRTRFAKGESKESRSGANEFAGIAAFEGQKARRYLAETIRRLPLKSKEGLRLSVQRAVPSEARRERWHQPLHTERSVGRSLRGTDESCRLRNRA